MPGATRTLVGSILLVGLLLGSDSLAATSWQAESGCNGCIYAFSRLEVVGGTPGERVQADALLTSGTLDLEVSPPGPGETLDRVALVGMDLSWASPVSGTGTLGGGAVDATVNIDPIVASLPTAAPGAPWLEWSVGDVGAGWIAGLEVSYTGTVVIDGQVIPFAVPTPVSFFLDTFSGPIAPGSEVWTAAQIDLGTLDLGTIGGLQYQLRSSIGLDETYFLVTPEPGTGLLLAVGLAGLGAHAQRARGRAR